MSINHSNSSMDLFQSVCPNSTDGESIITAFDITRLILLMPVSIFVLHLGNQQWRQHRSFKAWSHSDIFTYNLAFMELIWSLGVIVYYWGSVSGFLSGRKMTYLLISLIFYGESSFHLLTCVDRYLAVVRPVTYRELRHGRGVMIRDVSVFSVWMLSVLFSSMTTHVSTLAVFLFFSVFITSFAVACFCSFSVLCVLFRPGPGAGGRNRSNIDQSKQRAFLTVMAIMGVLCLFFVGLLISTAVLVSGTFCASVSFVIHFSVMWLGLPSSLVLPLFYLHKTGNLPCTNH